MNSLVKKALVELLEYVVAHEAMVESFVKDDKVKTLLRSAIAALKEVLPLIAA